MALRLVSSSTAPATPARPAVSLPALLGEGDALLRAREDAAWGALLLERTADLDEHRRWAARRGLLEQVLGARELPGVALASQYLAALEAALTLLDENPREPVLLNLAGVFAHELGALLAAEALFRGALRLDPDLDRAAANLREARRRRKAGGGPLAGLPPHVLRALRAITPRAQRLAARAVPAQGLTLSLCMIVKDEEEMLPRCLAAVRDFVDEIVVVDTGSTDRTVEIAASFGARVLHHAWTGDFSAARNVSFDAATGDWLLYLDADEVLVEGDGPRLRELTGHTWREGMFLVETNHTGDLEDGTAVTHNALRLFRARPEYRFEGRIHEQIAQHLPPQEERLERTTVRIEHFGYLGTVRDAKGKSERNISLLRRQVAEGADNPFLHFNLGSELFAINDHAGAVEHFATSWRQAQARYDRTSLGYFPSLATRYVRALHHAGRPDEAIAVGDEVLRLLPELTDVVLEQGVAHRRQGRHAEALACFARCREMGDAPPRFSATVGAGSFFALTYEGLTRLDQRDVAGAERVLRASLRDHPGFLAAVEPFARALVRQGRPAADVVAEVHALVGGEPSPSLRFLLAVPLYEAGAVAEAEAELRALLDAQPSADPARIALAEALLSQGRLDDAAREAAAVDPASSWAPAAARTELFARLAAGADAADATARATAAGLPFAELAAFGAWAGDAPRAGSVPAEAAPLVATMLEALARLEDFDGFQRLAGVAEALALPWRERRELLAGVYLRRGFLESAAGEWFRAVEREGPDREALLGLARVAELQGLEDDAAVFRQEAAALAAC